MSSHRPGRARPLRTLRRSAPFTGTGALLLSLCAVLWASSWTASSLRAQTPGDETGPRAADPAVEPTGDWLRFDEIVWDGSSVEIHLRTGYERPIILPEPVAALDGRSLPGTEVMIDTEVVLFAPSEHFATRALTLVGELTGTRYRLAVRSDPIGSRVPLRIVRR